MTDYPQDQLEEDKIPLKSKGLTTPEERQELGRKLSEESKLWESHRADLEGRWDRLERFMRGEPEIPAELPWETAVYRNIPILKAKSDAWLDYVCNPPTQANPYLVGTLFGKDATRAIEVEQDFYLFMRKARFTRTFRKCARNTGLYGKGIWRVRVAKDKHHPCFEFDAVRPRSFIIYPNIEDGIEGARQVGHAFEESYREIKRKQDEGLYYDAEEAKVQPRSERKSQEAPGLMDETRSIAKEDLDKPCRVIEAIAKLDSDDWFRVRYSPDDQALLGVWSYPYSRPWYFDEFLHEEQGRFWPETSRFNDLQDIQLATNDVWNQMQWGAQMGAFPTQFATGWALPQKYAKTKPGQVVPLLNGGTITSLQSKFDPSVMPLLLDDLYRQSDLMMRLGAQQQGATGVGPDKTATGANLRAMGASVSIDGDLASIDECMADIGAFMQELYLMHHPEFLEAYGDSLAVQDPFILSDPILWGLFGKSPQTTPQAQSDAAIALSQAFALFNPVTIQIMTSLGINVRELAQSLVKNSTLENRQLLLLPDTQPNEQGLPPQPGGLGGPLQPPGLPMGQSPNPLGGGPMPPNAGGFAAGFPGGGYMPPPGPN